MSKSNLVAANYSALAIGGAPDVARWCEISKLIGHNSLFVDRTGLIDSPFRIEIDERCRLPSLVSHFSKSYEQICDERANELLRRQAQLRRPIALLYSGGIDSTLMLVSFMKACPEAELRDRFVVYLNQTSINENPEFYRKFVRPKFRFESSEKALDLFDGQQIVVGAEFNDHLFGNYLMQILVAYFGPEIIQAKYDDDSIRQIVTATGMSEVAADFWTHELTRTARQQSVTSLETVGDFLWWFNFNYRWQAAYFSMILRLPLRLRPNANREFLETYFHHFFMTDDFQRWSMANPQLKIKTTWESYKWPAKDLIYRFNRDEDYRDNKIKAPSLNFILMQKQTAQALTGDLVFLDVVKAEEFLRTR